MTDFTLGTLATLLSWRVTLGMSFHHAHWSTAVFTIFLYQTLSFGFICASWLMRILSGFKSAWTRPSSLSFWRQTNTCVVIRGGGKEAIRFDWVGGRDNQVWQSKGEKDNQVWQGRVGEIVFAVRKCKVIISLHHMCWKIPQTSPQHTFNTVIPWQ